MMGMILGQGPITAGETLPFRHSYTLVGAGAEIVPEDAVQVVITIIGNGGGGSRVSSAQGWGGGSGAKATRTVAVDPADWGNSILYEITPAGLGRSGSIGSGGDGGVINLSSGVSTPGLTNWTGEMACYLARGATTGAVGAGGIADGGSVNTPGVAGAAYKGGTAPGGGAGGQTNGADGSAPGGGGAGGFKADGLQMDGGDGAAGVLIFDWS